MTAHLVPRTALRPAGAEDFDYCAGLYFEGMENIIKKLNLNMDAQPAGFRQRWDEAQVRITTLDWTDIGWFQSFVKEEALFPRPTVRGPRFARAGHWYCSGQGLDRRGGESRSSVDARALGVVKTNPALPLYQRLGFRVTHEDERKFYMRRDSSVDSVR